MKRIKKKKQLEIAIQSIPHHPNPKVDLEQYSTPANIAADLMWNAYSLGDIVDKNILDLGCGCGIFAIASKLLGSNTAIGVDIDQESLEVACKSANSFKIEDIDFICSDIKDFSLDISIDSVFQNPPFGSQKKASKGIDLEFIQKAISFNPSTIYSFHMASTEKFLIDYFAKLDMSITHIFRYEFPIPHIYSFHTKEYKSVKVIVIRAKL